MPPAHRIIKRLIIVLVYFVIFSLIGTGFYYLFRAEPTCTDKIRNQGETGIDCGGPCAKCEEIPAAQDLKVVEKAVIPVQGASYDALVRIANPNAQLGAAKFEYSFDFKDENGNIVGQKKGSSFILPAQTKYIFAFNISAETKPAELDFKISSFQWSRFSEYEEPGISVYAREFSLVGGGDPGFAKLSAKMRNDSGFSFREISAGAVIRNGKGVPLAVNRTSFNDVRVNEERELNFNWNYPFALEPASAGIEIEPEVNVFESDNYMKEHGVPGQYGSYDAGNE